MLLPFAAALAWFTALSCVSNVEGRSNRSLTVSFPDLPSTATNVVQDNFLGISWELFALEYLWGDTTDEIPNAIKNYLSNIRARMNSPLRIRVGGNSMDASTYVPDQTDAIQLTDPDAYYNDVPCNFGPVLFDIMNTLADTVGEMQFIIGLSMQTPGDDSNQLKLASDAKQALGSRLDAMLLGNEPDLYAGHGKRTQYDISDYIPEVTGIINDMENSQYGNLSDPVILGGPTVCCSWDLDDVLNAGLTNLPYKYYTIQHYPTYVCSGYNAQTSNISYYISHTNVEPFVDWNDAGMEIAKKVGVPMLLTEYNSASCGGDPSVAPTFATALWAVDVALQGAAVDYTGMYIHTREIGVTYNLFQPSSDQTYQDAEWTTGAIYYSELVVAEALSNNSIVVDLNLDNSGSSPSSTVAAYAIYDGSAHDKGNLVLFNYDYPSASQATNSTTQEFVIPKNLTSSIAVRYLLASNITEQTAITWAGQTVGKNGDLQGDQALDIHECTDGCTVTVPGPGLAVVWLGVNANDSQSGKIFQGNSTIAGVFNGTATEALSGATRTIGGAETVVRWALYCFLLSAASFLLS